MVDFPVNTWYEVSASRLDTVAPSPIPSGSTGIQSVMLAWSGGVLDSLRDRLVVWGGGHTNYAGNEIYAFSLSALAWSRLTNPVLASREDGSNTIESSGYYPDGSGNPDTQQPRSRHTYNFLAYDPDSDSMVAYGSEGYYQSGSVGSRKCLKYNFGTGIWSEGTIVPTPIHYQIVTGYDSVTGKTWIYGGGSQGYLCAYTPGTDTWEEHGSIFNGPQEYGPTGGAIYPTGCIDPIKRRFYSIGHGRCIYWDITTSGTIFATDAVTTGPQAIQDGNAPGLAFDPISQCIIGWSGGSAVYSLNTTTHVWTQITLAGSNTVTPTAAQTNGTYGRFRYSAESNVFVAVNATNENVYLFKLNVDEEEPEIVDDFAIKYSKTLRITY